MRRPHEWQPVPNPHLLFVYGTLRRRSPHPMARWLALKARYAGAGRLRGRLYHLGRYPGANLSERPDEWVKGDLYEIPANSRSLAWLDRYEGLDSGRQHRAEYRRMSVEIEREDGTLQRAWVYGYSLPVIRLRRLVTGDFLRQRRRLPTGQITCLGNV